LRQQTVFCALRDSGIFVHGQYGQQLGAIFWRKR